MENYQKVKEKNYNSRIFMGAFNNGRMRGEWGGGESCPYKCMGEIRRKKCLKSSTYGVRDLDLDLDWISRGIIKTQFRNRCGAVCSGKT